MTTISMTRLCIKKSSIAGYGVFSRERIPQGKVVFVMKGRLVHCRALTKKDAMLHPHRVGIGKDIWMEPDMRFVRYMNHSCDPNIGIKGRVTFVALRDIVDGEELAFDYSISEDSKWELKCSCGSKKCRGIIGGVKSLPKRTFDSYLPFIPRYFQGVYRASLRSTTKRQVK